MRRRRTIVLGLALAVVLGATSAVRIVLTPPRRIRVLSHPASGAGVRDAAMRGARFSPDGKYLLTSGVEIGPQVGWRPSVSVWRTSDWQPTHRLPHAIALGGVTRDGSRVLTTGKHSTWDLWEVGSWKPVTKRDISDDTTSYATTALSPNGAWVGYSDSNLDSGEGGGISLWNLGSGKSMRRVVKPYLAEVYAFSPDSRELACGLAEGGAIVIEVRTGRVAHQFDATLVAYTPDSRLIAGGHYSGAGVVRFWDRTDRQVVKQLRTGNAGLSALAFSGDGQLLAVGSKDKVQIFDVDRGTELATIRVEDQLPEVVLSSDGTLLAVTTGGKLEIWHLPPRAQLRLRATLRGLFR